MPKYGLHLKDIEKKVHKKISELELTPKYVFDAKKHQERFYTAPCRDNKNNKVVFKMRTEDFQKTKEDFRREIKINKLFTEYSNRAGKLSVPKFIDGDSEHIPEWMIYEFIEGYESGDFYNGLEKNNIKKFSVESLISGVKNMQKISAFAQGEIKLKAWKHKDFLEAYEKYAGTLKPFFTEKEIGKAAEVLNANKKILDASSRFIAHGDFHPGNLIITPQKEIAIIDWYYVHLNNIAFDISFLYLEITDKKFQKKILERFVNESASDKEEFFRLFRLNILCLAPQKINVLRDALYTLEPEKKDYYAKLTSKGIAKLETNLEAFDKALYGINFL